MVTNGGALLETITFPEILNENSVDTAYMVVTFVNRSTMSFDSRCRNITSLKTIKNSLTDPQNQNSNAKIIFLIFYLFFISQIAQAENYNGEWIFDPQQKCSNF